jgi:hypothetical protein
MIIESVLCEPTATRKACILVKCGNRSKRYPLQGLSPLQQHKNAVLRYLLDSGYPLQGHSGIGNSGRYVWSVNVVQLLEY